MSELELTRSRDDRKVFELAGVGSMRVAGLFGGNGVTVQSGGVTWECGTEGLTAKRYFARDKTGAADGQFTRETFGSAGTIVWEGQALDLRATGFFSKTHRVRAGETVLFELRPSARSSRPVTVVLHADGIPGGLIMFATYIVFELARRQRASSSANASNG